MRMIQLGPSPWEQAAELANHGQVAWLSDADEETYALMPAALAHAALEALEEIEDLAEIRLRRDEPSVPWVPSKN